jgi:hypothetical protein
MAAPFSSCSKKSCIASFNLQREPGYAPAERPEGIQAFRQPSASLQERKKPLHYGTDPILAQEESLCLKRLTEEYPHQKTGGLIKTLRISCIFGWKKC